MNINPSNSALNMINSSQQKANEAAHNIASFSLDKGEVGGSKGISANELFKPVVQLKEAELETSAAVKVLQADKKMLESILDVFA
jgi:hypothetical protein